MSDKQQDRIWDMLGIWLVICIVAVVLWLDYCDVPYWTGILGNR